MRKSTGIVMGIIVIAFGGMMVAADFALKPLKQYAAMGGELTNILRHLDMVEPQSKVYVLGRPGGSDHLAKDGFGMLIELTPGKRVRETKGRIGRVVYRAVEEARTLYARKKGRKLDWFEIKLVLPGDKVLRSLLEMDDAGRMGRPEPALPERVPLSPKAP
jgi:hypothetical protein